MRNCPKAQVLSGVIIPCVLTVQPRSKSEFLIFGLAKINPSKL